MNRAQQVEAELIRDPLQTATEVGKRLGVTSNAVRSIVQHKFGQSFGDLKREVFEGYYQRIEGADHD
jgi:hypothetical protein